MRVASRLLRVVGLVLLACLIYLAVTGFQVWRATGWRQNQPAGAIVVLGAAQYDGRPSPVLEARLDHAARLFERGLADQIWVTGANQPGDRFTEAGAAANYLERQGIPGQAIERETTGESSYEALAAADRFLQERGIDEVLLVSDPFHSKRLAGIASDIGLHAHLSPTTTSPIDGYARLRQLARETLAVAAGRLIGYRRLDRLDPWWDRADLPFS